MDYLIAANTDTGLVKETNQDSLLVRVFSTPKGKMVLAVLCDGMGGLEKGELASATVIRAFTDWSETELPTLAVTGIEDHVLRYQWENIVREQNEKIRRYGIENQLQSGLGTTVSVLLLTDWRYYILNIGDTRVYEIDDTVRQLTEDHTFVAREVSLGNLSEDQARVDPHRNILLQCVGASETVAPDLYFGTTRPNVVYLLCTDGFRHEISREEMGTCFNPAVLGDDQTMDNNARYLIELNKERQEKDNISVILIRSF